MTATVEADLLKRIAELEEQFQSLLDSLPKVTEASYRQGELDTLARFAEDAALAAVTP